MADKGQGEFERGDKSVKTQKFSAGDYSERMCMVILERSGKGGA